MIDKWVVLIVALASLRIGCCFPLRQTPYTYPHEASEWSTDGLGEWHGGGGGGAVYALPALALLITAVGLLLGCTWCYRHKDCKSNQGAESQLFSASIGNLHDGSSRRSQPPDSGFSEAATAAPPAALENNNNGPISLREMQNIANNNALGYIATEDEEAAVTRNRELRIEFEPLPLPPAVAAADPLAPYSEWFSTSDENFSRNSLQYLHEISTEHYGRVVKGEMDRANGVEVVVVKILDVNDPSKKVKFLEEARIYRELKHENILKLLTYSLNEQPWLLIFEYCPMYLREFLLVNRHRSAMFNRRGVHLHLMHDVGAGLSYMHSHGFVYGDLSIDTVLIREGSIRAVLGRYEEQPSREFDPPDVKHAHTMSRDVWSLGQVLWEICSWGEVTQTGPPLPEPALPCLYRPQLYQIMQCCWNVNSEDRPTAEHIYLMLNHLYTNGLRIKPDLEDLVGLNEADEVNESNFEDDGYISSQFEERWQSLKPNTIPTLDEHRAIIHAPSTSRASHFTNSDQDFEDNAHEIQDSLNVDIETAVSRSSSIMSDRDPLSIHIKSESLTNLHGSLEDVRNIYLTHNENAVAEDQEQNTAVIGPQSYQDNSDSSDINKVDPWLKDIISDSQDDVSYYRDVSDVIKNLDNILNSEKTSSSESSHQASPSRDALTLDCKKDYPVQSSLVKSPGISNFQSILETTPERKVNEDIKVETSIEEDIERETIGALNHSFERHSESNSQHTNDTLSPDTPLDAKSQKDFEMESQVFVQDNLKSNMETIILETDDVTHAKRNDNVVVIPNLRDLCIASVKTSLSNVKSERAKCQKEDCGVSCDKEEIIIPLDTCNTNFSLPKSVDYMPIESQDIIVVSSTRVTNEAEERNTELNKANVICGNREISSFDQHSVQNINDTLRSDSDRDITLSKYITSDDSTGYMDLTNETGRTILIKDTLDDNFKEVIRTCKGVTENDSDYLFALKNDSTIYLNLPELINVTNNLLHNERRYSTKISVIQDGFHSKDQFSSSTPKSSEELKSTTLKDTCETIETDKLEDVPESVPCNQLPGTVGAQLESKIVSENLSPFESPAKSHLTETYDENSSFALGPFEYSSLESFKGTKGHCVDFIEIPKEEQLAFSTHFAEIDLETPSPLRDINFLNEVPDIDLSEEVGCKNSTIICNEMAPEIEAEHNVESPQVIEMRMSQSSQIPATSEVDSTASTSSAPVDVNSVVGSFQAEMVKFNLTTRLAMAENENNLNIEQSGPISIEEFLTNNPLIAIGTDEGVRNELSSTEEHESETTHGVSASTELESQVLCRSETDNSCIILNADDTTSSGSPILLIAEASVLKELSESDNNVQQAEDMSVSNPENLIYIVPESILAGNGGIENEAQSMPNAHSDCIVIRTSSDDPSALLFETNVVPETVLAVGAPVYDGDSRLTLDDASVQALRNELELKLPIAQNTCDQFDESDMWSGELPPPPELIVNYPGALSPIAEETRQQLNAYENQIQWETSENNRTDSSESYPEPCNDSTAEVTDMVTAVISGQPDDHTYTVQSDPTQPSINNTYTVQKEATTSKELTMSADSLNVTGSKQTFDTNMQLNDDKTFSVYKDDDCEKLSQVSPFMLSPTTESSMPEPSDNGPGASTVSKTAPSDTKSSKPSETQCLSKATSIDSWCSNDTLFNVEDNFDDLAMDSDVGLEYEIEKEVDRSNSTGTLTDHDGDKETSHCSTYIVHDSKSDIRESFTPDSITANHTYTKPKNEEDKMSCTLLTKSEVNDSSAKNTPTRDLAYGTLISGGNSNVASHSNCTTEIFSGKEDPWKVHPQVEMVRHTKDAEESVNITPPIITDLINEENIIHRPKVDSVPQIKKMDSVDISCLHDNINFERCVPDTFEAPTLDYHLVNMGNSVTSTPIYPEPQVDTENIQPVPMLFPKTAASSSFDNIMGLPNLQSFFYSAELRPQDIDLSIVNNTGDLLEPEKQLLSASNTSSKVQDTYSDFEFSATFKPQGGNSQETNAVHSQCESGGSTSDEFHRFENSVRHRPQDLSVLVQVSPGSEIKETLNPNTEINEVVNAHVKLENVSHIDQVEESDYIRVRKDETNFHDLSSLQGINYLNSLDRNNMDSLPDKFDNNSHIVCEEISSSSSSLPPLHIVTADELINADESEHEQPHSIIITDNCHVNTCKDNAYDSHADTNLQFDEAINSRLSRIKVAPVLNGESHDGPTASQNIVQDANGDNVPVGQQIIKENGITSNEVGARLWNEPRESSDSGINSRTNGENFATVSFLKEPFEELPTSINEIDSADKVSCDPEKTTLATSKSEELNMKKPSPKQLSFEDVTSLENVTLNLTEEVQTECENESNHILNSENSPEMGALTEDFLEKEKKFCQFSTYLPLLGDIRFTGPGSDIISTSFNQESPTDEQSVRTEQSKQPDATSDELKEWDSDTDDSQSTNSSSGEFIWKDGEGRESLLTTAFCDHQRDGAGGERGDSDGGQRAPGSESRGGGSGDSGSASGSGSGSGSEGDEVEFVPSSWDCRAAPAKSSLRSLEVQADNKKRVVFKRQKYHCVYEYPREASDSESGSAPALPSHRLLPDYSTYAEWESASGEESELGYGLYTPRPLRAVSAYGPVDYDDDFFISSSARPFESLCVLSSSSQFFPGMRTAAHPLKARDDALAPAPAPAAATVVVARTRLPSLDFTTPDSGVEDVTPGSLPPVDDDAAPLSWPMPPVLAPTSWKGTDSASSSESVSPSSPGGGGVEALGGLRHTRDRLKLDLPPSPLLPSPSPRHSRVFSFGVPDKPRRPATAPAELDDEYAPPPPTFSTFGKRAPADLPATDTALILTDEVGDRHAPAPATATTTTDSGDEDSGIESSAKAAPAPAPAPAAARPDRAPL